MPEQIEIANRNAPFPPRMLPEETLLWEGRPNALAFSLRRLLPLAMRLPAYAAALLLTHGWHSTAGMSLFDWLIHLAPFAVAFWEVCHQWTTHANDPRYAITDRRVIIRYFQDIRGSKRKRVGVAEMALTVVRPKLLEGGSGRGTITLGFVDPRYRLESIDRARDVYRILDQARHLMPEMPREMPIFGRANERTFHDLLRQGEGILWRGKPDRTAFIRRQMWLAFCGAALPVGGWYLLSMSFTSMLPPVSVALWCAGIVTAWCLVTGCVIVRLLGRLEYFVTNQRIVAARRAGQEVFVDDRELQEIDEMRIGRLRGGIGTVFFEKGAGFRLYGSLGNALLADELAFHAIPDAEGVMRRIETERDWGRNALEVSAE